MSIRNWRPQAQLTATVRLSELAAKNLVAWLAAQPLPPRTANEALNMALESLAAHPVPTEVAALRGRRGPSSGLRLTRPGPAVAGVPQPRSARRP